MSMPHNTAVILAVGLTQKLIGQWSPNLQSLTQSGTVRSLQPVLPAVTCPIQSSMLTGLPPGGDGHGIVANGWYNHDLSEIQFWKQSNRLVAGEKVWDAARKRDPSITCANLFWWFNMYSSADYSVTPRPIYKADGRKIPDIYTEPYDLRERLQSELGQFPLFNFWGPASSIQSTQWIANAAVRTHKLHHPTLTLIYLPHLDYALQRHGPNDQRARDAVCELDLVIGQLTDYFRQQDTRLLLLSEYGIEQVQQAIAINRILREQGAIRIRTELGLELLDPGASQAFAVADHQIAHVYIKDKSKIDYYRQLCQGVPGIEQALDSTSQIQYSMNHSRSGELLLVASPGYWFCYDYWLNECTAPDFARTVDIHRKPGYDPRELFMNPKITAPKLKIAWKLLWKKLGQRVLMDLIPLDNTLVRGSHGRIPADNNESPLLICERDYADHPESIPCTKVKDVILEHLFED